MMAELRKRRRVLEDRVERTVSGSDEAWLRSFLIQKFLVEQTNEQRVTKSSPKLLSHTEIQELWEAGLIERVESLDGSLLMFAEGWDLATARAAMKVRRNLR